MQKVCVVIPCFNEQDRLPINDFIEFYKKNEIYFLFVNDGSTDNTLSILNQLQLGREDRIKVLNLETNQGKSEAVRLGICKAKSFNLFEIIGYMDADLATPLEEINYLIEKIRGEITFVFGSRVKRIGAIISRKWYRHVAGRIFATIASTLLGIGVYDTQCGAKFFSSEIIDPIFSIKFSTKWIFDLEIFIRFINLNKEKDINNTAFEYPLSNWQDVSGSKIRIKHLILVPIELLKLRRQRKKLF